MCSYSSSTTPGVGGKDHSHRTRKTRHHVKQVRLDDYEVKLLAALAAQAGLDESSTIRVLLHKEAAATGVSSKLGRPPQT